MPGYGCPEFCADRIPSPAMDIYALGACIEVVLTGRDSPLPGEGGRGSSWLLLKVKEQQEVKDDSGAVVHSLLTGQTLGPLMAEDWRKTEGLLSAARQMYDMLELCRMQKEYRPRVDVVLAYIHQAISTCR